MGVRLYVLGLWSAAAIFAAVAGFYIYLVVALPFDGGNVFGVASCAVVSLVLIILALVTTRKAAVANRAANTNDAYVRVEDGYEVDADNRASMYSPYGELKPIHQKLLGIIERAADETTGITIKARKVGGREVRPSFVGFRFIDWALREGLIRSRPEGVLLGRQLIRKRYVLRCDGKTSPAHKSKSGRELADFVDDSVFYAFAVSERPKLFSPFDDDVRQRLQFGFRPQKRGTPGLALLPVHVFAIPASTAAIALCWLGISTLYTVVAMQIIGFVLAGIAVLAFVGCGIAFILKTVRHFPAVKDEWNHPFKLNLFGFITLCILEFAAISFFIDFTLTMVVFYIGTVLQLALNFLVAARWVRLARSLSDINPSAFVPVVGLAAISIAAVPAGIGPFGLLILGAALVYWLSLFALLFLRLFFVGGLAKSALPMIFMAVATPSMLCTGYMTFNPVPDIAAQMLFGIPLFFMAFILVIRLSTDRVAFSISHWAYVYPFAVFAVASQRYANMMRVLSASANGLTIMLVAVTTGIASLLWLWAVASTIYGAVNKRLVARETHVLSEEMAAQMYAGKKGKQ